MIIYVKEKSVNWDLIVPIKDIIYLTGDKEREAMVNYSIVKNFTIEHPSAFFDALFGEKYKAEAVVAIAPNGKRFYYPYFKK